MHLEVTQDTELKTARRDLNLKKKTKNKDMKKKYFLTALLFSVITLFSQNKNLAEAKGYADTLSIYSLKLKKNRLNLSKNSPSVLKITNKLHLTNWSINKHPDGEHFFIVSDAETGIVSNIRFENNGFTGHWLGEKSYEISTDKLGEIKATEVSITKFLSSCYENTKVKNHTSKKGTSKRYGNMDTYTDVLKLESFPGAPNCIYIDTDGEANLGAYWAQAQYGYIKMNDANLTDTQIYEIWEEVSEDFLIWNFNVTTSLTVFNSYAKAKRQRAIIGYQPKAHTWKGLAITPSWGNDVAALIDADLLSTPHTATATSHEIGHTLSLKHDGNTWSISRPASNYYTGHGDWVPIMGSALGYTRPLSQWSKGEYAFSSNQEDDIAKFTSYMGLRPDEPSQIITPGAGGVVSSSDYFGIIQTASDVDSFRIDIANTGILNLRIGAPNNYKGNLDVRVQLINNLGSIISDTNIIGQRHAEINENLSSGTYYLKVMSGKEGTVSTGWSTYGSIGYYEISGSITETITNINDFNAETSITNFPNPFENNFNLNVRSENSIFSLMIFNTQGVLLQETQYPTNTNITLGENLRSGVYLIKINTESRIQILKVLKN